MCRTSAIATWPRPSKAKVSQEFLAQPRRGASDAPSILCRLAVTRSARRRTYRENAARILLVMDPSVGAPPERSVVSRLAPLPRHLRHMGISFGIVQLVADQPLSRPICARSLKTSVGGWRLRRAKHKAPDRRPWTPTAKRHRAAQAITTRHRPCSFNTPCSAPCQPACAKDAETDIFDRI